MNTSSTSQNPLAAWVHQNLAAVTDILVVALIAVFAVLAFWLMRRRGARR